jgi:hypothetical protein
MLNILGHKGNANQRDTEISFPIRIAPSRMQTKNAVKIQEKSIPHCWWE